MTGTIFALSSGLPPAAIAVLRISGVDAGAALERLAGALPPPRHARLATLRDPLSAAELDCALILWFPGPASATGEDLAEIHAHGGRAVVRAIEDALAAMPGLRCAEPGEFTRRALTNGRIDLAEAEGLADLLEAETEGQRRQALALAGGALSRTVAAWQERLLGVSARIEAMLDFADEDDVVTDYAELSHIINILGDITGEWHAWLARPSAERLRDGITVAIAGPPNAGKSTLLNALSEREAAITSPQAGTTRDIIEVALAISGVPFRIADTAGLHAGTGDAIEAEGMARAARWIAEADLLLWLGPVGDLPDHSMSCCIASQADVLAGTAAWQARVEHSDIALSAKTGEGMDALRSWLLEQAVLLLPHEGEVAINRRHHAALSEASASLSMAITSTDPLLIAEGLRGARLAINRITGQAGTEDMLDALFGRFCIGK